MWDIPKMRGWTRLSSGPTFWECPPPMAITFLKAQGKIYHEPNLCRSQWVWRRRFLCLLLNGGGVGIPLQVGIISLPSLSRHNNPFNFCEGNWWIKRCPGTEQVGMCLIRFNWWKIISSTCTLHGLLHTKCLSTWYQYDW